MDNLTEVQHDIIIDRDLLTDLLIDMKFLIIPSSVTT